MKKRILGWTGVSVSELCFGTMNFGWTIGRETAFALLDTYWGSGGSFFQAVHAFRHSPFMPDTFDAPEEWLGEWIKSRAISRNELVLGTRLVPPVSLESYASTLKDMLLRQCEHSLRKMKVTYLDLLVCEWSKELLPTENLVSALESLMRAGYVRRIAFANLPLWRAMEIISLCREREIIRLGAIQTGYSRATPGEMRAEVDAFCETTRTGLLATSALGGLQSAVRKDQGGIGISRLRNIDVPAWIPSEFDADGMSDVQRELSWVLASPQVSSVVISAHTVSQLEELIRAANPDAGSGLEESFSPR